MVSPNNPISRICATIASGNSSACSSSIARGCTSRATKRRTLPTISAQSSGSVGVTRGPSAMPETVPPVRVDPALNTENNVSMPRAPLHHALETAAGRHGGRVALLVGDERWTYADLGRRAEAFAAELAGVGIGPGDRVAVMSGNRPEFVAVVNGLSKLGAATVLVSPAWKHREVSAAVELTGPAYAVADGAGVEVLTGLLGA